MLVIPKLTVDMFLSRNPDFIVTPDQVAWAKYLEQQGGQLCVDFGFANAETIAWEIMQEAIAAGAMTIQ
jgi:hypothetical protein